MIIYTPTHGKIPRITRMYAARGASIASSIRMANDWIVEQQDRIEVLHFAIDPENALVVVFYIGSPQGVSREH
jgi:hypothetical protein